MKPTNEVYGQHQLATRKQDLAESLDQRLRKLYELGQQIEWLWLHLQVLFYIYLS